MEAAVGEHEALRRAQALMEVGRARQAAEVLRAALTTEPTSAALLTALVDALLEVGGQVAVHEAWQTADLAVQHAPGDWRSHLAMARVKLTLGDADTAVRAATTARTLAPTELEPLLVASVALSTQGKRRAALALAGTARDLYPAEPETHAVLAFAELSRVRTGPPDLRVLAVATALTTGGTVLLFPVWLVVFTLLARPRIAAAARHVGTALRIDPAHPLALDLAGQVQIIQGRHVRGLDLQVISARRSVDAETVTRVRHQVLWLTALREGSMAILVVATTAVAFLLTGTTAAVIGAVLSTAAAVIAAVVLRSRMAAVLPRELARGLALDPRMYLGPAAVLGACVLLALRFLRA
jgi:tetratricopeptide (TPR) repeat protein